MQTFRINEVFCSYKSYLCKIYKKGKSMAIVYVEQNERFSIKNGVCDDFSRIIIIS